MTAPAAAAAAAVVAESSVAPGPSLDRERARQQALLDAIWSSPHTSSAQPWFHHPSPGDAILDLRADPRQASGLRAYRANAAAAADRALAAACPTVRELMGADDFAALARVLWHRAPPSMGDLAQWGGDLPAFLAADPGLQDVPYLADVARVDLAVHHAEMAADAALDPASLQQLAEVDAEGLRLSLAPGATLIESPHPVAAIWQAHRQTGDERFAAVRAAFAAGQGEAAFVWREGWRGAVVALDPDTTAFHRALLAGATLAGALDAAPALDFEAWLTQALQRQWLAAVVPDDPSAGPASASTPLSPETP